MNEKQHTIANPVTVEGVGLHTGKNVTLRFNPAEENFGIQFKRTDLPNQPIIEADANLVVDTQRGTTLRKGDADLQTIEHVLAALTGLQIDLSLIHI